MKRNDHRITAIEAVLLAAAVLLTALRIAVSFRLPIWGIVPALYDDALMAADAQYLSQGLWLGPYNEVILTKGIVYPMALCISGWSGISIHVLVMLAWVVCCLLFTAAVKPRIASRSVRIMIYVFLLMNPAFSNKYVYLRVYRNSITMPEVLLIVTGVFGVYLRHKEKAVGAVPWILLLTFGYTAFCFSREDAVWILPFLLVSAGVIVILEAVRTRSVKRVLTYAVLLSLPFITVFTCERLISVKNRRAYGTGVVNELSEGAFSKAMKTVYRADPGDELPWDVSVSREKLKHLYAFSPSLKELEDEFDAAWDGWDAADRNPGDGEIEDGWFFWAFRDAAARAGYHQDPARAEALYLSISRELNEAMESGALQTGYWTPYALIAPIRPEYLKEMPATMLRALRFLLTFKNLDIDRTPSMLGTPEANALFERLTSARLYSSELRTEQEMQAFNRMYGLMNAMSYPYRLLGVPLALISLLGTCLVFVKTVRGLSKKAEDTPAWAERSVMLLSVILTQIVFLAGISYNDIASCETITAGYLPAGYVLALLWEGLSIVWGVSIVKAFVKNRRNSSGE